MYIYQFFLLLYLRHLLPSLLLFLSPVVSLLLPFSGPSSGGPLIDSSLAVFSSNRGHLPMWESIGEVLFGHFLPSERVGNQTSPGVTILGLDLFLFQLSLMDGT